MATKIGIEYYPIHRYIEIESKNGACVVFF